ncbi:hypothetical protein ACP6JC_005075 [Aspergillus fumigatus]
MVLDEAGDTRKGPTTPYPWFIMARKGVIDAEIPPAKFREGYSPGQGIQRSDCFLEEEKAVEDPIAANRRS